MTYPTTFELGEKAEVEYALKRMMAERLEAGFGESGNDPYVSKARALRKIIKTDGIEYYKPVHKIQEIHY